MNEGEPSKSTQKAEHRLISQETVEQSQHYNDETKVLMEVRRVSVYECVSIDYFSV